MKKIIEMRLTNTNNATHEFFNYLEDKGINIKHGSRKYAIIDDLNYAITITNSEKVYGDCRQFNTDEYSGLITLHEKTGLIYLFNENELSIGSKTREFSNSKFKTAQSIKRFSECEVYDKIEQVCVDDYQELFISVAEEIALGIVNNAISKML